MVGDTPKWQLEGFGSFDEWLLSGYAYPGTTVELPKGNGHDPTPPDLKFSAPTLDGQTFAPVEWLIEGILPTGLAILAGKSKIGKSWLALDIAIAVSSGAPAFSKITTRRTAVLYIALEDGRRRLQSRMRKLLAGGPAPERLEFAIEWPRVGEGCFEEMERHLDLNPCRLIVLDTFGKVRGDPSSRNPNVYQQDYRDMGEFHELAQRRNICLLLIHHTRKQEASDVIDLISGSTGIVGAADTLIILQRKRTELLGTLAVTGRDIIDDGEFAVSFDKETGKWTMLGEAKEVKSQSAQDTVFQFLLSQDDPVSPTDISNELEIPFGSVKVTLNRLKKKGSVENPARGLWTVAGRKAE